MNEHEEIAKVLKARLSELRTHLAKVDRSLRKPLPADSEDQAIELENQEALEVIEKCADIRTSLDIRDTEGRAPFEDMRPGSPRLYGLLPKNGRVGHRILLFVWLTLRGIGND